VSRSTCPLWPPVLLSVFEVRLADRDKDWAFRDRLHTPVDDDDDQVGLYPLPADSWARRLVYGNRTLEERASTTGSSDRSRR